MALDIFEFVAQLKRAVWNVGADEQVVQKFCFSIGLYSVYDQIGRRPSATPPQEHLIG